ncbi:MAG: cytidylate kinase-like family protein [Firmicutes bacterium]|nr:cytidylate kinase-like family protein [Bacillota bacterium]
MSHYAITITRQFGSLGRPIARELAEELGINYYDRDIVESVAQKTNLSVSEISNNEEVASNSFWKMKFPIISETRMVQDHIFEVQKNIIQDIAAREDCIIVGRCSDYVLKEHKMCIHIYIFASEEQRMKNCVEVLHLEPQEAKRMIKDVDRARDSYHTRYAGYLPNDENHQDIMINSGLLGTKGTAQALAEIIRKKLEIGANPSMKD